MSRQQTPSRTKREASRKGKPWTEEPASRAHGGAARVQNGPRGRAHVCKGTVAKTPLGLVTAAQPQMPGLSEPRADGSPGDHARPPRRPRRGRGRARGGAARGKRREHAEKRLIPETPRRQKRRPPPKAERAFPSRSQADAMRRCRRYEEWCRNPRGEGESPGGNAPPPPPPAPRESGSG